MPRPKGSKNQPKTETTDFATQIAERQSAEQLSQPKSHLSLPTLIL